MTMYPAYIYFKNGTYITIPIVAHSWSDAQDTADHIRTQLKASYTNVTMKTA